MPSSAVLSFSEPDDYAHAVRETRAEVTITGRGRFAVKLTRIELHRLWMHRSSETLPRVVHAATASSRANILFGTRPGQDMVWAGVQVQPTAIVRLAEGDDAFCTTAGAASWGSMSLPIEAMVLAGATVSGCDVVPSRNTRSVTPPAAEMARLQRLHAAVAQLAEDAPEILAHPEAARCVEQSLVDAMVGCLGGAEAGADRLAHQWHGLVMRRFWRALHDSPDQAVYIPDLCAAIGVSARTLRVCCDEHLGMAPCKYLVLRRLHLARRALLRSGPASERVTDIAMQFGFWQLGRFAVEYRSLFGESPSATLARSPS